MNDKWRFELVVVGISEEKADDILRSLILLIETDGGKVEGGFLPSDTEVKNEQEKPN